MSSGTYGPPSQATMDEARKALGEIVGDKGVELIERLIELALQWRDYSDPDDRR